MSLQMRERRVLVTGAGSGLGEAVARRLASTGHRVTGTVRDRERASRLTSEAQQQGLRLDFVPLELSNPDAVRRLASELSVGGAEGIRDAGAAGLDVLVHNAGYGVFGAIEEVGAEDVRRQFEVNVFGPLELTRLLLPTLRRRKGQVIWIGSLAGRIALPFQGHYSATKAAIASLSDALRIELAPFGVRVTCIEPGDFSTGFTDARRVARADASPYAEALARCLEAVDEQERGGPKPEWVGRVVERLVRSPRPPARRPVGQGARTMCALLRVLPDRVRELVVSRHYRQK